MAKLKKAVVDALNNQVAMEAAASHKYLAMACWADDQALEGVSQFMFRQSMEEREHMMKLINFLLESGAKVKAFSIPKPQDSFKNVIEMFEIALSNEEAVSSSIDELCNIATKAKDFQTHQFLQWYVSEQHEEESLFNRLIDRMKLIGLTGQGLYFIDEMVMKVEPEAEEEG